MTPDEMRRYWQSKIKWHEKQIGRHQDSLKRLRISLQCLDEIDPPFVTVYRGIEVRCSTLKELTELCPNIRTITDYKRHRNRLAWNDGVDRLNSFKFE